MTQLHPRAIWLFFYRHFFIIFTTIMIVVFFPIRHKSGHDFNNPVHRITNWSEYEGIANGLINMGAILYLILFVVFWTAISLLYAYIQSKKQQRNYRYEITDTSLVIYRRKHGKNPIVIPFTEIVDAETYSDTLEWLLGLTSVYIYTHKQTIHTEHGKFIPKVAIAGLQNLDAEKLRLQLEGKIHITTEHETFLKNREKVQAQHQKSLDNKRLTYVAATIVIAIFAIFGVQIKRSAPSTPTYTFNFCYIKEEPTEFDFYDRSWFYVTVNQKNVTGIFHHIKFLESSQQGSLTGTVLDYDETSNNLIIDATWSYTQKGEPREEKIDITLINEHAFINTEENTTIVLDHIPCSDYNEKLAVRKHIQQNASQIIPNQSGPVEARYIREIIVNTDTQDGFFTYSNNYKKDTAVFNYTITQEDVVIDNIQIVTE